MSNRDLKAIWIVFLSVVLIFLGGLYFFGLTSIGGRIAILWVLQKYIDPGKISIGHVRGDFIRGITFSEIILQNTKYLSVAHTVRLAQFNIRRITKSFVDFEAEVQQGAVELPNSMPIHFEGGYSRNIISARIQSLLIDINNLAHFLPKSLPRIESAKIVNLDLNLKGDVLNPNLEGSATLADINVPGLINVGEIKFEHVQGVLIDYLIVQDVQVSGVDRFPPRSTLKIQNVRLDYRDIINHGVDCLIKNARFELTQSNLIIFSGGYRNRLGDFNIYSRGLNIQEIFSLFPEIKFLKMFSGSLAMADIYVRGSMDNLVFEGEFLAEEVSYSGFSLKQSPVRLNINLKPAGAFRELSGAVTLEGGRFTTPKTEIDILPSHFYFDKDAKNPGLDLHAVSTIDKTKIQILVRGTKQEPELFLQSEPPRSKEMLMVMVATGQGWQRSFQAIEDGAFNREVVKDFVNYFIFNGHGATFAQRLGLDSLTIKYDQNSKGFNVGKKINDQLKVNYGLEKPQMKPGEVPVYNQKIGGEVKVTDHVAVEASKSSILSTNQDSLIDQAKQDGQADIKIKYRRKW